MAKNKNQHQVYNFDTIIIGSGPAGSTAAEILAHAGQKVAVVEAESFGGECLNYGCIPTKSMLAASHLFREVKNQKAITNSGLLKLRISKLVALAEANIIRTGAKELAKELSKCGVTTLKGRGYLINAGVVDVAGESYSARNIIIAGGGEVAVPNIPGLDGLDYITYKNFLSKVKEKAPKSVTIIGGGAVGCEYAQILSSCGIKVNVVECAERLISDCEPEASKAVYDQFIKAGIKVFLKSRIVSAAASSTGNLKELQLITPESEAVTLKTEAIMLAAGKKMRDGDGLANAGIHCENGLIATNSFGQSAAPSVYAIGDAAGPYRLTSTALMQAKVAAHNILAGKNRKAYISSDYSSIPSCIFTLPEVARVGESVAKLKERGVALKEVFVPLSQVTRSRIESDMGGFVKLWAEQGSSKLIGACIVGPAASEQISFIALAIKAGIPTKSIADLIAVFPTWSEAVTVAASEL